MLNREQEILNRLEVINNKLNIIITQNSVQEHRITKLEETQSGVIKFTGTALLASIGALGSAAFKLLMGTGKL